MEWFFYIPLITAGLFAGFFVIEQLAPLRLRKRALIGRLLVNGATSGLAFATAFLFVRPAALQALDWSSEKSFGLVHILPGPGWLKFLIGFLLLDLSFYYWHVMNHKLPLLWRFHNVHHIDPDLDVSTGFRFHFGEVLLSTVFRAAQVTLSGVSLVTFAVYEITFQANTLFHHSNLRLPIRMERALNRILVTPRMHGIHHSEVRDETNSNYGVVFCWWDKLHRTIGLNIPQTSVVVGIPGYSAPEENRFWRVLLLPFRKQRDYWRRPDGSIPKRDASLPRSHRSHLAE